MRHLLVSHGLDDIVVIESAGTGGWNVGNPPDARSRHEARRRGIEMGGVARQFEAADFDRLDLVVAMDHDNAAHLRALAPDDGARAKVRLLREFDPDRDPSADLAVPDPYYGGADGFTAVFDMVEAACGGLLEYIRRRDAADR